MYTPSVEICCGSLVRELAFLTGAGRMDVLRAAYSCVSYSDDGHIAR